MISKIYLDMDGVVADFHKRYVDLFKMTPTESREQKEFHPHWKEFILTNQFASLDWWYDGQELLDYIKTIDSKVQIEMLTSSGGLKYHDQVKEQKLHWLKEKGITYKANVVAGRRKKAEYATPDVILVDDTLDVIESFNAAGGIGIHHKDAKVTIEIIKAHLNSA
jgi:hypothetical protein